MKIPWARIWDKLWEKLWDKNVMIVILACIIGLQYGRITVYKERVQVYEGRLSELRVRVILAESGSWHQAYASTFGRGDGLMGEPMYCKGIRVNDKTLFFASRFMPMGTKAEFYNPNTKKRATAICLDWGPHERLKRDVDLGPALCDRLEFKGLGYVMMRVVE